MPKRNIELDRLLWPKDSLKRTLLMNHPGCESAVEAVKQVISDRLMVGHGPLKPGIEVRSLVTEPNLLEYQAMHDVIEELKVLLKDFDYESLPHGKREELANMPAKTIDEAKAWRDAWKAAVLSISW